MSVASVLGKHSILPESSIQTLRIGLWGEDEGARISAISAFVEQSRLSEPIVHSLNGTVQDEVGNIKKPGVSAFDSQPALSKLATQSLVDASNDSTLPESAIQSLIGKLSDGDKEVRLSAAIALGKQSTLSEPAVSLIGALMVEDKDARVSAPSMSFQQLLEPALHALTDAPKNTSDHIRLLVAYICVNLPTVPESAMRIIIGMLGDEDTTVRMSAVAVLRRQSALSESVIHSVIAGLGDDNGDVKLSAALILDNQTALPQSAIEFLIETLKDEDTNIMKSAATVLGNQSRLSESAIKSLIGVLKDKDEDIRKVAAEVLENQSLSLCDAIPDLSEDEITYVHKYHLFPFSCRQAISLQVRHGRLHWHTKSGPMSSGYLEPEKLKFITETFQAILQV